MAANWRQMLIPTRSLFYFTLFLPLDILHFNNWIKIELLLTINVLMVVHLSSI